MFKSVSIIIPALNEEKVIGKCLEALIKLDKANLDIEIIVVDNGSIDTTVAIAGKLANLTLVKKNVNISELRNYGVEHSKGDLLAFVDADCIVAKDWLDRAIHCMMNESADAVGSCHAIPEDASWIGKTIELRQRKKIGAEINYIPAGNIFVKRSSFLAIGGFDESLITNEDVDLCYRLKHNGYRLFCDPSIKSIHLGTPKKIKEIVKREMWHGTNTITIFLRDVKRVRNFRIVLYTSVNLILILGVILGILLFLIGKIVLLAISLSLYLLLHIAITFAEWRAAKKNFFKLFFYTIIYGFSRSLSMLNWISRSLL